MEPLFDSHDQILCGTLASQSLSASSNKDLEKGGPTNCVRCFGVAFIIKEGDGGIDATPCPCVDALSHDGHGWERISKLRERADYVNASRIPNRYIKALNSKNIPVEATRWLESYLAGGEDQPNFFFFYGDVGTGKTHTAAYLLLEILKSSLERSVLYLPVYEFIEWREQYLSLRFSSDKSEKERAVRRYNWTLEQIRIRDVVVLDELGQEKLNPDERKIIFKLLDDRYNNNKVTILISNHCDNKDLTLEGKLLKSLVGTRISSRLKSAREIYFRGADRRAQEGGVVITQAEIENFIVPAKIQTHDENTHQIMTWLARNPAFDVVSPQRRNQLTEIINGEAVDKNRENAVLYEDVWVGGDKLIVNGPVCDHEDKKLYGGLLKELAKTHKEGIRGLSIELSLRDIMKIVQLSPCGDSVAKIKRQLNRLSRMSMSFRNARGNRWDGPLVTEVFYQGTSSDQKVKISFSHFMITFYRLHEYTTYVKSNSEALKGDSSAFYFFYSSHLLKEMTISVDKCKKLLAIPDKFDKNEALKRVIRAVQNLIDARVMDPKRTSVRDGKVHTCLLSAHQ